LDFLQTYEYVDLDLQTPRIQRIELLEYRRQGQGVPSPDRFENLRDIATNRSLQATESPPDLGTPSFGLPAHRHRASPKTQIEQYPIDPILACLAIQTQIPMIVAGHLLKNRKK
jgi:hypothetical protein